MQNTVVPSADQNVAAQTAPALQPSAELSHPPVDHLPAWLDFAASVIGDLAWPLCVFAIVCLFRNPLLDLIREVEIFEGLGLRAKFRKQVRELAERAASLEPTPTEEASPSEGDRTSEAQTERREQRENVPSLQLSAEAMVLQSWGQIEDVLRDLAGAHDVRFTHPAAAIRTLQNRGLISDATAALLTDARMLRNRVAHARHGVIDREAAWTYMNLAKRVIAALEAEAAAWRLPDTPQ